MLELNEVKKGVIFKYKETHYIVLESSHTHKGRGGATLAAKIRDLSTGKVLTTTFKPGDKIEEVDLKRISANFLYKDLNKGHFMSLDNYEEIILSREKISHKLQFLKEGQEIQILELEGIPLDIDIPPKVELKVMETEPGVKGNTAAGTAYKPAVLETGFKLNVPLFVETGDVLKINTETGQYVERVIDK